MANPREWDELTSVEAGELVGGLREAFQVSVAMVHPVLEELAPLTGLEGRFDAGRRVVEKADEVLLVAAPSPVGLVRCLGTVADARSITAAPIHVAVNRAPKGRFLRDEWADELTRLFTPASLWFLPLDRRVARAAWDGSLAEGGGFVREVRRMAAGLIGAWAE